MRSLLSILLSGFWMCAASPVVSQPAPVSDVFRFRELRQQAQGLAQAQKWTQAAEAAAQARAILPSAPSILLLGAQIELAAQRPERARAYLKDYLRRGLWFDRARYPAFEPIMDAGLLQMLSENGRDLGAMKVLYSLPEHRLIETVSKTSKGEIWAASIFEGGVGRLKAAGVDMDYQADPGSGVFGVATSGETLWAIQAVSKFSKTYQTGMEETSSLIKIDSTTAKPIARYQTHDTSYQLGDLSLGQRKLYISEGRQGAVLSFDPAMTTFETLIPTGLMASPQGHAEAADAQAVIIADYASGLYRHDLTEHRTVRLNDPDNASLLGIDGLYRYGNDLIAVQNGVRPPQILRITLSKTWRAIERVEVIARGGGLDEPTGGFIEGDDFIFVARSQWSDFNDVAKPKTVTGPAVIVRLQLKP